ncbi:TrkH family potassium uptake protein [Stetteria hydrogenophila]
MSSRAAGEGSSLPYIGLIIVTTSAAPIAAGVYGAYRVLAYGDVVELRPAASMAGWGLAFLSLGLALARGFRAKTLRPADAIALTVAAWILIPALGSLPLAAAARIPLVDAFFESVSGWTTTGLTVFTGQESPAGGYVPSVSELPRTVQVWRAVIQWMGGLGIVVLTLSILARPGLSTAALYIAEGRSERLEASIKTTSTRLLLVYVAITGIATLLYLLAGMDPYDAVSHALTSVATGGFSTRDESIGYWLTRPPVLFASMAAMYLGAMNLRDNHAILTLRRERLAGSVETKAQAVIVLAASLAGIGLWLRDPGLRHAYTPLQMVFHTVSAATTTGFQAGDLSKASDAYKAFLAMLCLVGGSAFSTAGGIKVIRLVIVAKALSVETETILHPYGYKPKLRVGRYLADDEVVRRVLAVSAAMVAAHVLLTLILAGLYPQYSLADAAFETASALGTVGLSVGITSAAAPTGVKLLLAAAMLLGRLEVIPYIIALKYVARRLRR